MTDKYNATEQHPLLMNAAILPTRAIEEFVNVIKHWLNNLLPGGVIYGVPRIGKTKAIQYLMDNTSVLLGSDIPMTMISCWESNLTSSTESRFYSEMLQSLGYELARSGNATVKSARVTDFIVQTVRNAQEYRFVLFVDEAQWLQDTQFRCLMALHNQLGMKKVSLITILVGQPDLLQIKANLRSDKRAHILERFMTGFHRFTGATCQADFSRMLRSLDIGSEYPHNSGCSYTKHFVPKAFSCGWRIETYASKIWLLIETICRREHVPKTDELPMQALIALLRYLLQRLSDLDSEQLDMDDKFIEEAIYQVAFLQIEDHAHLAIPLK